MEKTTAQIEFENAQFRVAQWRRGSYGQILGRALRPVPALTRWQRIKRAIALKLARVGGES